MSSLKDLSDRTLLEAYADTGDTECLGVFLKRYETSLVRFVSNFLGDEDAAQDIVQETFLRVAKRPGRLLGIRNCHNWLLKVARNLSIDHLRRLIRQRKHQGALNEDAARKANAAGTAGEALEKSERETRVRNEIGRLRPRLKEIMLLKVQESKSYREIAEITGLTVTNVGYLVHQALQILRQRLRDLREEI
ncbi:MAG: sigma-70 family RNA polymerase sigma factor [Planctomycetota bacterium]|nr:sigma-70 family RNA polymerase sigma factor [Planctomycetota bacterium]